MSSIPIVVYPSGMSFPTARALATRRAGPAHVLALHGIVPRSSLLLGEHYAVGPVLPSEGEAIDPFAQARVDFTNLCYALRDSSMEGVGILIESAVLIVPWAERLGLRADPRLAYIVPMTAELRTRPDMMGPRRA